jgi:hypothetical protein
VSVPAELRKVVLQDTSNSERIILPGAWHDRMNEFDGVRSVRDLALDEIRTQLLAWLREDPRPEAGDDQRVVTINQVQAWKSSSKIRPACR